ncbi:unnamed protein product [Ilex paraguariensis]|uniref:Cupin type-1 domain-containing protein n=1 Tax=Ilex paraguariensis TaxID=185542 RepID=A0ABC8TBM3_9AQUA
MGTMGWLQATAGAHHVQARGECRIQRPNAQEPNRRLESEAGVNEFWDTNDNEKKCAGVKAIRHMIQPRGLLLPAYNHAHQLTYIVEGWPPFPPPSLCRGIQGTIFPGCARTYESGSQSSGDRKRKIRDCHQKLRRFQEGDILALPAGVTHWAYNDGEGPLTCMALVDTGNEANQLDENFRGEKKKGDVGEKKKVVSLVAMGKEANN